MKNRILLPLLAVLAAFPVISQAFPLKSKGALEFWVDGASFAGDNGNVWQEFYWSFKPEEFATKETLAGRVAKFRTVILLRDMSGKVFLDEGWNTVSPVPSDEVLKQRGMVMIDQIEAKSLKPGKYHLTFSITDLLNNKNGSVDTTLDISGYSGTKVSNIEMSSVVYEDTAATKFKKGTMVVKPWPIRVFPDEVYYYYEGYNLPENTDTTNKRYIRIAYYSDADPSLKLLAKKDITSFTGRFSDNGGFKVTDLAEGGYHLKIQIIDSTGVLAGEVANFAVKRSPLQNIPMAKQVQDEMQAMIADGDGYYDQINYIASSKQYKLYESLDENGKKEFLRRFWKARDPNPATPENEALIEHARRYRFADANFSEKMNGGLKGSVTDRGRIYIKYGPPDERDNSVVELQSKPIDTWMYNNGMKFVFIDKGGFGRYFLVYSKTADEPSDPRYKAYFED